MSIRVLLVDDQALVRMGFNLILSATDDIVVIGEAADGDAAVRQAELLNPDVILMDVRMPIMDGVEATRRICAKGSSTRVLVLTTFDLDEYAYAALHAGASGFLLKDVRPDELCDAIRAVAAGDAAVTPRITAELLSRHRNSFAPPAIDDDGADPLSPLTAREREVFGGLVTGLTNAEIGEKLFMSEATVKVHVSHILSKLNLRDRVQVVIFAYGHGLQGG